MPPKKRIEISFSGCGFMGVYHAGVQACFREFEEHIVIERAAGTSAGALAAAVHMSGVCLGRSMTEVLSMVCGARAGPMGPLSPRFDLVRGVRSGLFRILPADAHVRCSGRLGVSVTRCRDGKNVMVTQFDTLEDLVQVLLCASFVPLYSGLVPPYYKDARYWDGGVTNNMPIFDSSTVTVSPFAGECDICPRDHAIASLMEVNACGQSLRVNAVNAYRIVQALFPPHPTALKKVCEGGYTDALRYIKRTLYEIAGPAKYAISTTEELTEPAVKETALAESEAEAAESIGRMRSNSTVRLNSFLQRYSHNTVNLPGTVLTALRDASATEQHPVIRVLSLTAMPWTLPIEFMYFTSVKLLSLAPLPSVTELQNFLSSLTHTTRRCVVQVTNRTGGQSGRSCNRYAEIHDLDDGSRPLAEHNVDHAHSAVARYALVRSDADLFSA